MHSIHHLRRLGAAAERKQAVVVVGSNLGEVEVPADSSHPAAVGEVPAGSKTGVSENFKHRCQLARCTAGPWFTFEHTIYGDKKMRTDGNKYEPEHVCRMDMARSEGTSASTAGTLHPRITALASLGGTAGSPSPFLLPDPR